MKAAGTRELKSGTRRDYRCTPTGGPTHRFSVVVAAGELTTPQGPPPRCPDHGDRSTVSRDGTYGPGEEPLRRQRYRCVPLDAVARAQLPKGRHWFTPERPREHVHPEAGPCPFCEERRGVHHGDEAAARRQTWNLRVVAEGLARVARGESYSSVGRWAWETTGRNRTRPAKLSAQEKARRAAVKAWRASLPRRPAGQPEPEPPDGVSLVPLPPDPTYQRRRRLDEHGHPLPLRRTPSPSAARARARWHTSADWTATYSGAVWQPLETSLLAAERAEHDRRATMSAAQRAADGRPTVLLLDDLPIATSSRPDGYGGSRVKRTYFLLAAATIDWTTPNQAHGRAWERAEPGRPQPVTRLRLVRGFATNEAESWLLLFHELGYVPGQHEPEFVLADAALGLQKAARQFFQTAVLLPSMWHVQDAIAEALQFKTPGAMVLTDLGRTIHPALTDLLTDLSADQLRTMGPAGWSRWWDDLLATATRLGLPTDTLEARRDTYEPVVAKALPALAANPGVPLSTGGMETVLRTRLEEVLSGRTHALTNIERLACLLDLVVARDRGVFDDLTTVVTALRNATTEHHGWAPAPRQVADPQPPVPATYSSLRDRELPTTLAKARGLA